MMKELNTLENVAICSSRIVMNTLLHPQIHVTFSHSQEVLSRRSLMVSICLYGHIFASKMTALTNKDLLNLIHLKTHLNSEISRLNLNRKMKKIFQQDLMTHLISIGTVVNQKVIFPLPIKWDSLCNLEAVSVLSNIRSQIDMKINLIHSKLFVIALLPLQLQQPFTQL